MPYIQIWQSSTGKIRLTGSQKPKGNMAKGVPLTPPESNSNVSSPKASDHDGQAANQDRCDVMIDMLLAASRWTKATDHRVNLLVAACEMIDMPTQDITSLADACLDEARMPLNRGREEFVENADVDGKATKKVRIEEREDSQSSGEGSQNPRQKPVGDRAVWSDLESEAAFIAAQVSIPPIDPRSKITAFGRHLGRNQLIAIVVSLATGRLHDRKAISSHGQTLRAKNNKKGYPEHLFEVLGGKVPKVPKEKLQEWEIPGDIKDLIGMPRHISSLGTDWTIPGVRYADETKGVDKMVPPGIDKEKAEVYEE